jgi:transposase
MRRMDDLINLTDDERVGLQAALGAGLSAKQYRRAQALQLLDDGAAASEVAELLGVSRQTVYNWSSRFQHRRSRPVAERLLDAPRDGRPATVGEIIDELLDEVLDADPRTLGYRSTVWTAELFQDYLRESFRIAASRRSVQYALRRLRIRWKRPRHTLALRAPAWRQAKGA